MLSYQHAYHAGSLADVHKHSLLCAMLDYMLQKDKPFSYVETHAGRGLYDLSAPEAEKTGEAKAGILRLLAEEKIPNDHPYRSVLARIQQQYGKNFYPGSPMIAATMLRACDRIHLAEKHPQEISALRCNLSFSKAHIYAEDGYQKASALLPPTPRRGMLLVDPSYEIKGEYKAVVDFIAGIHRKWPAGVIALWYPILSSKLHAPMIEALEKLSLPKPLRHEVLFVSSHSAHRLQGSGMFIIKAPFGVESALFNIN